MFSKKIILASKSPRRSQLLKEAGFDFEVKTISVEENYPSELPVVYVAEYLARKKANASISLLGKNEILLTADSIVILGDKIFGKPANKQAAQNTLKALSGNMHQVITGVCIKDKDKEICFSGVSKVFMSSLTDKEINYYIDQYKPYDKAGSYGIQEWIGLCKINKIEGTYANIMGLPIHLVYRELMNF